MVNIAVPVYLSFILGFPTIVSYLWFVFMDNIHLPVIGIFVVPFIWIILYVLTCGILSIPTHHAIKNGRFLRNPKDEVYKYRILYGLCWTMIYYFPLVYNLVLQFSILKKIVFKLFGYKGQTSFKIYPDTWIRDFPILTIGEKAYLSNKATIGTNICLQSGHIFVENIIIGPNTVIGHLAMIAPGTEMGKDTEIGVGTAFGVRSKTEDNVNIGPGCVISHGTIIRKDAQIGMHSYIGLKCEIKEGILVPPGSNLPSGTILGSQKDCDSFISSETNILKSLKREYGSILTNSI